MWSRLVACLPARGRRKVRERRRREIDATPRGVRALKRKKLRRASGLHARWRHRRQSTDSDVEQSPEGGRQTVLASNACKRQEGKGC